MSMKQLPNYRLLSMLRTPQRELVPWNYRELIQGWIYKHLGDTGRQIHDAPFSLFTFSLSTPDYKATQEGLVSDTWLLRIASAHQDVLDALEKEIAYGIQINNRDFQAVIVTKEIFAETTALESNPILNIFINTTDDSEVMEIFYGEY